MYTALALIFYERDDKRGEMAKILVIQIILIKKHNKNVYIMRATT